MDQDRLNQIVDFVLNSNDQHANAMQELKKLTPVIASMACFISEVIGKGNKIMVCGNGGSAADAQHFAAEFTGRMVIERSPLPCIALTTDTSALTAIANDYGFDQVFSRQVEAIANEGDLFLGISTSGNSQNVIKAAAMAKSLGCTTYGLIGGDVGSELARLADASLCVPSRHTPRIQELHIYVLHTLIDTVDRFLLGVS